MHRHQDVVLEQGVGAEPFEGRDRGREGEAARRRTPDGAGLHADAERVAHRQHEAEEEHHDEAHHDERAVAEPVALPA